MGPMQGYVLPGGVEHSAYCGPEGALVLDVFRPVREDYRERWQAPRREPPGRLGAAAALVALLPPAAA